MLSMIAAMMMFSTLRPTIIYQPIVRAAPAGEDAAAYLVIANNFDAGQLVGLSCACAERVEIHEMAGSGGERRMNVLPALDLPHARLVEIQPGSNRHLMLIGLRAPLVAGQSVPMTLRYANGRADTIAFRIVADTRAAWAEGLTQPPLRGFQPVAFLAGSCWRGAFPDGRQTDTHCFSPIYGGRYMQDRHIVGGAPTPYSGDTLYTWETMSRQIRFEYNASDGSRSVGRAVPAPNGLSFPEETHSAADGSEMTIRSSWTRDGDNAYVVLSEARQGAGWRELWRMRMERIGPTPIR